MSIRRGWTQQEDKILVMLKQQRNIKKWSQIARIMDFQFHMCGRNGKQCRQRFKNHLDQQIIETQFTLQDQRRLEQLILQNGNKWCILARHFQGRTGNFLKNQIHSKLRKSIRKINKFLKTLRLKSVRPFNLNIVFKIIQSNDYQFNEKQQHSGIDIKFYQQLKQKVFRYAESQVLTTEQQTSNEYSMRESLTVISLLTEFLRKYNISKNKPKKRKTYICQDDIILNSLSNNRTDIDVIIKKQKIKPNLLNPSSKTNDNNQKTDDNGRVTSIVLLKKQSNLQIIPVFRKQSTVSANISLQNSGSYEKNLQKTGKSQQFPQLDIFECRNFASIGSNQSNNIMNSEQFHPFINSMSRLNDDKVDDGFDLMSPNHMLLEQSQQLQFVGIEYLENFNSNSRLNGELFQ